MKNMLSSKQIGDMLQEYAVPTKTPILSSFFKTGKSQYGYGDEFIGVTVPNQRKIVNQVYDKISLAETIKLLQSPIHEHRLTAVLILVKKYTKTKDAKEKDLIFETYLKHKKQINNWDLIDLSAPNILGTHLLDKDRSILYTLAKSDNLWDKRIAIMSTFTFIRAKDFDDTLQIAEILLNDTHDLIHKAVGWMLREIGKRDFATEENFVIQHYTQMPRTMLRYAIEKFPAEKRKFYMKK
jgi:3-methyladenine DNA glycosylase AlkD